MAHGVLGAWTATVGPFPLASQPSARLRYLCLKSTSYCLGPAWSYGEGARLDAKPGSSRRCEEARPPLFLALFLFLFLFLFIPPLPSLPVFDRLKKVVYPPLPSPPLPSHPIPSHPLPTALPSLPACASTHTYLSPAGLPAYIAGQQPARNLVSPQPKAQGPPSPSTPPPLTPPPPSFTPLPHPLPPTSSSPPSPVLGRIQTAGDCWASAAATGQAGAATHWRAPSARSAAAVRARSQKTHDRRGASAQVGQLKHGQSIAAAPTPVTRDRCSTRSHFCSPRGRRRAISQPRQHRPLPLPAHDDRLSAPHHSSQQPSRPPLLRNPPRPTRARAALT